MKKRMLLLGTALVLVLSLSACGKKTPEEPEKKTVTEEIKKPKKEKEKKEIAPEGMCRSDLTNEWIDEALKEQRPIAAVIDNETVALPHYGVTGADIVYEMMNSKLNGRITRLMALVKDWGSIEQLGNIRSARPTNVMLAAEWNAVLCHDGGPFYIDDYLAEDCVDNITGGFARIDNGKSREFTEYITTGELESRFESGKISTTYNKYYEGPHFQFAPEKKQVKLKGNKSVKAERVALPFPHNLSCLEYNKKEQLYYYSEYEKPHVDPGNHNIQLSFKNLIIQDCDYTLLDENGYMTYNCIGSGEGYFITNGRAVPMTWKKEAMASPTQFYDLDGKPITLNTGKTYIALVPSDMWEELGLE